MIAYQNLQQNKNITFISLCEQFRRSQLILPPWQRGVVWSPENIAQWRLMLDEIPEYLNRTNQVCFDIPGVITIFSIRGQQDAPKYLNDGNNRTQTTLRYLLDLSETKGLTQPEIFERLGRIQIQFQEWEFEEMIDAFIQWNNMNKGTTLTAFESGQGVLAVSLGDFDLVWKPYFDTIDRVVFEVISGFYTRKTKGRVENDRLRRDNRALFYRYISNDTTESDYSSGKGQLINLTEQEIREGVSPKAFEFDLAKRLKVLSNEDRNKVLQNFERLTYNDAALLKQIYEPYTSLGVGVSGVIVRWMLHSLHYFRHRNIDYNTYSAFLTQVARVASQMPQVRDRGSIEGGDGGEEENIWRQFGLGNMKTLPIISRIIQNNSIVPYPMKKRKKSKKANLDNHLVIGANGFHKSHYLPVSVYGDGDTFMEPAAANMSRGAQPVTIERS